MKMYLHPAFENDYNKHQQSTEHEFGIIIFSKQVSWWYWD